MIVDINREGNLDFSSVKLLPKESTNDMVKSYMKFQGGSELNLSQKEIDMFQAIDKNHHDPKGEVEMVLGKVLQGRLEEVRFWLFLQDMILLFINSFFSKFNLYACSFYFESI